MRKSNIIIVNLLIVLEIHNKNHGRNLILWNVRLSEKFSPQEFQSGNPNKLNIKENKQQNKGQSFFFPPTDKSTIEKFPNIEKFRFI